MNKTEEALKELIVCVKQAIKSGDWIVDGACDPDLAISRAEKLVQWNDDDFVDMI
jgi:hypothetical protein